MQKIWNPRPRGMSLDESKRTLMSKKVSRVESDDSQGSQGQGGVDGLRLKFDKENKSDQDVDEYRSFLPFVNSEVAMEKNDTQKKMPME